MISWGNSWRSRAEPRRFGLPFAISLIIAAIWGLQGMPVWGGNNIALSAFPADGRTPPSGPSLNLESGTSTWGLSVSVLPDPGALFIYTAPDLPALVNNPTLLLQTNTPLLQPLVVPVLLTSGGPNQTFFSALFWPNRSVDEFGDPEYHGDEPPPPMVLFSSDLPPDLGGGQTFTVDFYVGDPTGESLNVSGTAGILVVRETDGMVHPDATVVPPTGQMINGVMRVEIAVKATTSVAGYTLGLRISSGLVKRLGLHASDTFLKIAFGLGPAALTPPQRTNLKAKLEQRRQDNMDEGPTWSCPLAGGAPSVSGIFGEWRGRDNNNVHRGVDFAAPAGSTVTPSRAGVVSHRGRLDNMGDYLVVDHGRGWFSRYLHLDADKIVVHAGQAVSRTTPLATGLYAVGNWPRHLHFEVRHGTDQAAWETPQPGSAQDPLDPLQTPGMFAVAAGTALPRVEEFGLTRHHPGKNLFVKASPTATNNGPVYVFAKLLDLDGGHRLGLRSMSMEAELAPTSIEIEPRDDAEIARLLPPGAYMDRGFALYSGDHAAQPDPVYYYRYWWRWDTSAYAQERKGPRSIVLTGVDHNPSTNEFRFSFGPEVVSGQVTETGARQYQFTLRVHLGTNTPAALVNAALFVQPDEYKLEIVRTNGQAVTGVTWKEGETGLSGSTSFSRPYSAHRDEQSYVFMLPDTENGASLRLRVSSRMVPDIGHEVALVALAAPSDKVWIPPGTFTMGSPSTEVERSSAEGPQTQVTLTKGYWMGKYEVTQREYQAVMGCNPSWFTGDLDRPVEGVSWVNATDYCAKLTISEGAAGHLPAGYVYRLPTEAEWEYACRAGTTTATAFGNSLSSTQANFDGDYPYNGAAKGPDLFQTTKVGSYDPNAWGLYDMHGNVREWCLDWYESYPGGSVTDPRGLSSGSPRILRGGSWSCGGWYCRSAARFGYGQWYGNSNMGFRVVLAPGP